MPGQAGLLGGSVVQGPEVEVGEGRQLVIINGRPEADHAACNVTSSVRRSSIPSHPLLGGTSDEGGTLGTDIPRVRGVSAGSASDAPRTGVASIPLARQPSNNNRYVIKDTEST